MTCLLLQGLRRKALAGMMGICLLLLSLTGCGAPGDPDGSAPSRAPGGDEPAAADELRGVWVAYTELNALLDGQTVDGARAALDALFDDVRDRGLNAVFFHARANSDAYYASEVFPPAATAAPLIEAGFDPLAYAVQAAHERGLALHAWVNPYRIGRDPDNACCDDVFSIGDDNPMYYYVPTSLEAQALILRGVEELSDKYAVDGIHFDDYFYPNNASAIPRDAPAAFEQEAYTAYGEAGGRLSIGDWRRAHVNALVAGAYRRTHARAGCVFGVSPYYDVQTNYVAYYADLETWAVTPGYVDYLCPQIYFGFENANAPFANALASWASQPRADGVALYVGLALYKTGLAPDTYAGSGANEWAEHDDIIGRQVSLIREQPACGGFCLFSYRSFDAAARAVGSGQTYDAAVAQREIDHLQELLTASEAQT